jgi:hypothetical protein
MSVYGIAASQARSLKRHWQTPLPDTKADNISLLNHTHVQYQSSTEESTVEKLAETQTSIWLASHLVQAPPYSRSGRHEFETPMWREFGALTKSGKTLGVKSFYNNYFLVSRPRCVSLLHYFSRFYNFFNSCRTSFSAPLCMRGLMR